MDFIRALLLACLCAAALVPGAAGLALAKETSVPQVQGRIMRDHARLTFEWPQTVYFTAKTSGRDLILTFDRKANPDMARLLSQMSPYVTHVTRRADGRTLVLSLDKPYRIRTFVSESVNGVDLLGIDPKASRMAKAKPAALKKPEVVAATNKEPAPQLAAALPAKPATAQPKAVAIKPVVVAASAAELAQLAPAAGEETAPVAPVELKTPAPEAAPQGDANPVPPDIARQLVTPNSPLKVNLSAADDSAVIRIPFATRTAMAVFTRNRYLWVVFNRTQPVDLSDFDAMPRTVIGKAQLIKHPVATVLRMPIDDGVYVHTAKEEENSFDWAILLTPKPREPQSSVRVIANVEPPSPPHVFVPVLDAAEPVLLTDPQIGDKMIVTPFYNVDQGLAARREFSEFSLLASPQGLALVKKADAVSITPLRNGLRISQPGGVALTPGLPELRKAQVGSASVALATLFPYSLWVLEEGTNPRKYVNQMQHRIVQAADVQEANAIRLKLAQYYLSEGMAAEALAYLDGINRTNPSYFRSAKLAALRGAANFLMYRFLEASRDFGSSELNNNKEIDYWRSMLADLLGNPDQSYDYLTLNEDYFSKYPPKLRQRLAIVAADRAVGAKEYNTALKIFDSLQEDRQVEAIGSYINFLMAKISAETKQEADALEIWDKLAEDYRHPFVRANAEFARVLWGMNNGKITKEEGIDRLEKLRLAWHGDNLEMQVLTLLGDLYSEQKDYLNAMRIWHNAIQSFSNTSMAITMTRRMQEAFIVMFKDGGSDELPALEALALYYEYRAYMPSGNTGDELMERLADRLVSVDLLDQATALLDHQMKTQTEKEKRSRVGAKLATVHLLNHEPKLALQALQESVFGENPLLLKLYRNRLAAEAMLAQGQSDKALETLGQDNSVEAERLRIAVFWQERDWKKIIASIEGLLKQREDTAAAMTLEESEMLLKLALAYMVTGDTAQLAYLRDYFTPLMEQSPNREVFAFLTTPDVVLTTRNFDALVEKLDYTRRFVENYSARIKTAGLEAPTAAPATATP